MAQHYEVRFIAANGLTSIRAFFTAAAALAYYNANGGALYCTITER